MMIAINNSDLYNQLQLLHLNVIRNRQETAQALPQKRNPAVFIQRTNSFAQPEAKNSRFCRRGERIESNECSHFW